MFSYKLFGLLQICWTCVPDVVVNPLILSLLQKHCTLKASYVRCINGPSFL